MKKRLEADINRLERERDNLIAVQAHLSDPKTVAEQINDRDQQIGRLEAELENLPGNDDGKLADKLARMKVQLTHFRELIKDRRNASLARQVIAHGLGLAKRPPTLTVDGRNGR